MAESTMTTPLGTEMPSFALADPDGRVVSSDDLADAPALAVLFICNHCPYVKHVRDELAAIGRDYGDRAAFVAINSNDVEAYPDDAPDQMRAEAATVGYPFPYVFDETQEVAKTFGAACTPDVFVYDADRRLAYRGRIDATRPKTGETPTGADLRAALDAILDGKPAPEPQYPSMGCGIKWKPGNAPDDLA